MKLLRALSLAIIASLITLSMQPRFDFAANEEGKLFEALPESVRKSGKKVTLIIPDCKEAMIVQIENNFPKGTSEDQFSAIQVVRFTPEHKSQQVHFLEKNKSINSSVQQVVLHVMPEATWHLKIEETKYDTTKQPNGNKKYKEISKQLKKAPQHTLEFKYDDIKNNQVIKLPCPSENTPNINQIRDHMKDITSGVAFESLPASVRRSGKTIKLSIQPAASVDMVVKIFQQVVTPSGDDMVTQKVIISASAESVTIDIPQTPKGKGDLSFWIAPLRLSEIVEQQEPLRKNYNPNHELKESGAVRLLQALATDVKYNFDTMSSSIALPNPLEILHDLLGCNC